MINIVLFGPPGAGKGTQADRLKEKYGFNHISTGDVIRAEIAARTPLGLEVSEIIARGELVSDEQVIRIIEEYMEKHRNCQGNIFDGFPRTTIQAVEFDKILARHGQEVNAMLSLDVADDVLIERILQRASISGREDDSDVNVIRNRISVYKAQTAVVADYYAARGKYTAIDGSRSIDEVFSCLCGEIDKLKKE